MQPPAQHTPTKSSLGSSGPMQFTNGHSNDLWGRAKRDPDWLASDGGTIVHVRSGQRLRRSKVDGRVWESVRA